MRLLGSVSSLITAGPAQMVAGAFAVCFVLGSLFFLALGAGNTVRQPIAFNHAKHVANGMACTDCHPGAQNQAHATLPTVDVCLSCHESSLTQNPDEAKIRSVGAAGGELRWAQLTRVPAHVYFSHRRHVQVGGLDCATCHGAMEKATVPPSHPFRPPTMDACLGCHKSRGVRTDCNDCHR